MFIDMEPLVTNINSLFPTTLWISVEVNNDPKQGFTAWVSHETLGEVVDIVIQLKDYTAM